MAGKITEYPAIDLGLFPSPEDLYDVSQITAVIIFPPSLVYESRKVTYAQLQAAITATSDDWAATLVLGASTGATDPIITDGQKIKGSSSTGNLRFNFVGLAGLLASGGNNPLVKVSLTEATMMWTSSKKVSILTGEIQIDHDTQVEITTPILKWVGGTGTLDIADTYFTYLDGAGTSINAYPGEVYLSVDDAVLTKISVQTGQIELKHDVAINSTTPEFFMTTGTGLGKLYVSDTGAYFTHDGFSINFVSTEATATYLSHDTLLNFAAPNLWYVGPSGTELFLDATQFYLTIDGQVTKHITMDNSVLLLKHDIEILLDTALISAPVSVIFNSGFGIDTVGTGATDILKIGVNNANQIDYGNGTLNHTFTGTIKGKCLLNAGTVSAGFAPLKFTSGTNLTVAEAGAFEYDGTNFFATRTVGNRENIYSGNNGASAPPTNNIGVVLDYYGTSATRVLTTPDSWASVNIGGTVYRIPLYVP